MASETVVRRRLLPNGTVWPSDDTEESVLGTDLHQTTLTNLRWGINEAARVGLPTGQPVPWHALSQTAILGGVRPDGSLYRLYPDVFVYPRPIDPLRGSVSLAADGPPALVVEVLSDATYEVDLDMLDGKGFSYARAGVREYLTHDPAGQILPERIRAWRLAEGQYHPWSPEADGRWHSATLGLAIGLEDGLAVVYTAGGRRILREGEVERELARRDAELARRDEELAGRDAELTRLRRLLDERRVVE